MASFADKAQLLHSIDQKLKRVKECFECFQEDFKNVTYVGGDIQERLGDCCVESIGPFEGMIDGFLDTLNTFDWGLKTTLDAWLQIHSHLAGRCYSQCKLLRNINIVRNMSEYLLRLVKPYFTTHREGQP